MPSTWLFLQSLALVSLAQPTEAGWNTDRTAAAFNTLMAKLGYEKYGVQGGDAGAVIAPSMGRQAPENIIGIHLNAATMGFIPLAR